MKLTERRFFPNRPQNLDAVMAWKMEIEHDDTGTGSMTVLPLKMDEFERLLPVGDDLNFDIFIQA